MVNITYFLLYAMLFSPIIAFVTFGQLHLKPLPYYFSYIFTAYGVLFMLTRKRLLKIPDIAIMAMLWALYLIISGYNLQGRFMTARFINGVSIFFIIVIIYNTKFNKDFIKNVIKIFKITVVVALIVSVIQVFNSDFYNAWALWHGEESLFATMTSKYEVRRVSIFNFVSQNEFGLSYLPLLAILTGFLLYHKEKRYLVFVIMGGLSALLTNARYIILGFLVLTLQIFLAQKIKLFAIFKYSFIALIITTVLANILIYFGYDFRVWIEDRLFFEGSIEESTRYRAIYSFIVLFPHFFIWGSGGMTEEIGAVAISAQSSQVHVGYLSALLYFGIVGCTILFTFWFLIARRLRKTALLTNYWGSFFGFLIFLVANFTLVMFSLFFYGLIFTFVFDKYFSDKYQQENSKSLPSKKYPLFT